MRDSIRGGALTETTFLILLSLWQPRHGYGVMQFLKAATHGRLSLGAGTLYGALNNLLERGWIAPCGESAGRRKEYCITPAGKTAAMAELDRMREVEKLAAEIVKGGEGICLEKSENPFLRRFFRGTAGIFEQNGLYRLAPGQDRQAHLYL